MQRQLMLLEAVFTALQLFYSGPPLSLIGSLCISFKSDFESLKIWTSFPSVNSMFRMIQLRANSRVECSPL